MADGDFAITVSSSSEKRTVSVRDGESSRDRSHSPPPSHSARRDAAGSEAARSLSGTITMGGPSTAVYVPLPPRRPRHATTCRVGVLKDGKARWSKQHGGAVCRQSATCWRVACARVRLVGAWPVLANLITLKKIRAQRDQHGGGTPRGGAHPSDTSRENGEHAAAVSSPRTPLGGKL